MDIHGLLQELGFGDYEAKVYVALVSSGQCNGYEVAKTAGLPRANVYSVLEKLVERGAAQRMDTSAGTRYAAVDPQRLLGHIEARQQRALKAAQRALSKLAHSNAPPAVFNLHGRDALLGKARECIDSATNQLLVAIQPTEAAALADALREAHQRGVAITTLCMEGCGNECGGCQGSIQRLSMPPDDKARWLMLVVDHASVLAGEITPDQTTAISTSQHLIVELAASYIQQSIALATVAGDLGDRFRGLLSEPAQQILEALRPQGEFFTRLAQATKTASA
ncbi:MAG: hypothetical protein L0H70_01185 [Xanthomonadales bacterium]|nr:hypothetical protein [Xanthomonadales bacterium]